MSLLDSLNVCVLRIAHVYGAYSSKFIATALTMARVYQHLEQEMKWLWTANLRINTVHVLDCARAMWEAATWYASGCRNWDAVAWGHVPIFNIVDHGNTSQGQLAEIIGKVFKIPTGFQGQIISSFARMNLESVVDDVNDETLGPWADLLEEAGIKRPGPLSPFMEKELLKDTDLSLDGRRFESVVGFKYEREKMTREEIEDMLDSYRRMNWWP